MEETDTGPARTRTYVLCNACRGKDHRATRNPTSIAATSYRSFFFCIVHVKRVYLSVLSHGARLCYPYFDAERARPAEVPQNPPPLLPSTSQCLSSLHIATSRFSFTFAAVTIYVGECSTSSTVSVTRVMLSCVLCPERNVGNSVDDVFEKFSGRLNSCTVHGSLFGCRKQNLLRMTRANLDLAFRMEISRTLEKLDVFSFSKSSRTSCSPQSVTSDISMRDRTVKRWLSIKMRGNLRCRIMLRYAYTFFANWDFVDRGQLYTMQFFLEKFHNLLP